MKVASFADVMGGYDSAEIICAMKGTVVRTLTKVTDGERPFNTTIHMACPNGDAVDVEPETPLVYEPWFMDRGSILFNGSLKLCTELDRVRYPDGTEATISPAESIVPEPEPVDYDLEPTIEDSPTGSEMVCSFDDDSVVPNPR